MKIDFHNNRKLVHLLMIILVVLWGLEYIAAKFALEAFDPLSLTFCKYAVAALAFLVVRIFQKKKFYLKRKHILTLVLCALFGQILYFAAEYSAMGYLPVSTISIILAFVPLLSIVIEAIINKRKPNTIIVLGIIVCILGVSIIIGVDFDEILSGKWIGYVLAFSLILFWNAYNFITERLSGSYESSHLAFMQVLAATLLSLPIAIAQSPEIHGVSPEIIGYVLFLGITSGFLGFLIYVMAISVIGPTPCALYSNFLPISTSILGWIFLGEKLTMLQMLGGVIVIASAAVVIWQKGVLDDKYRSQGGA